jgi:uncharacterized protein (TIGR02117 family)
MVSRFTGKSAPRAWPIRLAALVGSLLLAGGCTSPAKMRCAVPSGEPAKTVYLVRHGWHTGVVVRRDDVPPELWPEKDDFPNSKYLEVGWGDADFYRAQSRGTGLALRSLLLPTRSVLHVAGFNEPLRETLPPGEAFELVLSDDGLREMCRFIQDTFRRDDAGRCAPLDPGIYGVHSAFYPAHGTYCLTRTCNVWTAAALYSAGYPIRPCCSITAGAVLRQAEPFAQPLCRRDGLASCMVPKDRRREKCSPYCKPFKRGIRRASELRRIWCFGIHPPFTSRTTTGVPCAVM